VHVKTDSLYTVKTTQIAGKFYRYVRTKYGDEPMAVVGSIKCGGRYNVAGLFGALYLGFDTETCEIEVSQGIAAGVPFKNGAFTAWDYNVELKTVIRLDDRGVQAELEISQADITIQGNHWTASGIGEHLHKRGDVEGLVAPSAQHKEGLCLDVYLDRVTTQSHVIPQNKIGTWP
jgi:RES domain-containing protein